MTRSPSTPSTQPVEELQEQAGVAGGGHGPFGDPAGPGNGARVDRSATSSTATIRPRPRMSPAAGWPPRRPASPARSRLLLGLGRLHQAPFAQHPQHGPAGGGPDHVVE